MLLLLLVALVFAGCGTTPPWPNSVDVSGYRDLTPPVFDGANCSVSLAGVKAARGGLYVDLFVVGPPDKIFNVARSWGDMISGETDSIQRLEVRTDAGNEIRLLPMSQPPVALLHAEPASPPGEVLDKTAEHVTYVQRAMLRTRPTIRKGEYLQVRLMDPWAGRRQIAGAVDVPLVDTAWQRLLVAPGEN